MFHREAYSAVCVQHFDDNLKLHNYSLVCSVLFCLREDFFTLFLLSIEREKVLHFWTIGILHLIMFFSCTRFYTLFFNQADAIVSNCFYLFRFLCPFRLMPFQWLKRCGVENLHKRRKFEDKTHKLINKGLGKEKRRKGEGWKIEKE